MKCPKCGSDDGFLENELDQINPAVENTYWVCRKCGHEERVKT